MSEQTFIACPLCGEPIVMSPMQLDIYRGRALTCARCARQFTVDPQRTPLYALSDRGGPHRVDAPKSLAAAAETAAAVAVAQDAALDSAPSSLPDGSSTSTGGPAPLSDAMPVKRRAAAGGWKLVVGIVGGFLIIAVIATVLIAMMLRRAEEETNRIRCASNLSQINTAIQSYARNNQGRFPDTLDRLLLDQTIAPASLVCPSTPDTPAVGSTPQAWVLALQQPGHQSYVYVGRQLTLGIAAQSPSRVVMYEPMTSHHGDGATVLYADGSVTFLDRVAARTLIARITMTATAPATPSPTN